MLVMCGLAIWLLSTTLEDNRFLDIRDYIAALPLHPILTALAFTAVSYVMLIGYDPTSARAPKRRPTKWN